MGYEMSRFTDFFKNAFSVENEDPDIYAEEDIPQERKAELIAKFAQEIVDRRLAVPAIMFLETVKPLSFLGSQAMIFFEPIIQSVFAFRSYREIYLIMEKRENVEVLLQEIERREGEKKHR
jgi:hypothetical protein